MKKYILLSLAFLLLSFAACNPQSSPTAQPTLDAFQRLLAARQATKPTGPRLGITMPDESLRVSSPDGRIEVLFGLLEGVPCYSINRDGAVVILPSRLGFTFLKNTPLNAGLRIVSSEKTSFDETWTQPWGEVKNIRDHHNELRVRLTETGAKPRQMVIVFRAFDDGVGFRYELPEQPHLGKFQIMDEQTEFAMSGDHQVWWIPAFQPAMSQYLYRNEPLSKLGRGDDLNTPLTMQTAEGLYLSIHEAALINYSSMSLKPEDNLVLKVSLVPWSDGILVKGKTPLKTPWRTIQIAERPGDLITSYLILNLNEPNVLGDVSWVKPRKYIGIWWGMHIGKWTWASGPQHGATTENTKAYLDFAAKYGFPAVLVEGWNLGWDGIWENNGNKFDFTRPYPDFDLEGLAAYAESLGVKIIPHDETSGGISNYESQMEEAFALYRRLGIDTVKVGYVASAHDIKRYNWFGWLAGMEWYHGQYKVEHQQKVVETAARYGIMIDVHEPVNDTGLRRTYPNLLTREGARGQEFNAWDPGGGNPPDHATILPFTRLLSGPMDYTPGILKLTFPEYRRNNRVNHTLAKELALYVVIYSPLQMAADLIENYEGNPAFQFILDVPCDWEETRVLHAQVGDFITTVRRERDGDEWFLGSVTDENPRTLEATLDFLTPGVNYVAQIYSDGAGADWKTNPYPLDINQYLVDSTTRLTFNLAPGGGQAIRFYPASAEEIASLPKYQP